MTILGCLNDTIKDFNIFRDLLFSVCYFSNFVFLVVIKDVLTLPPNGIF